MRSPVATVLQPSDLPAQVAERCFPTQMGPDRVGLELEFLVVVDDGADIPSRRSRIGGREGSRAAVARSVERDPWCVSTEQGFSLHDGGGLTWEPGGQIELSPGAHDDVDMALDGLDGLVTSLADGLHHGGHALVSTGTDRWTDRSQVPQQLAMPRYRAMNTYLDQIGPWGRVMMRHTASLQVNLDAGQGDVVRDRWAVANLLSPLNIGTFASSPANAIDGGGAWSAVSERSVAWQQLDPSRTGVPQAFIDGEDDPVRVMTAACLAADVMFILDDDGGATAGRPGWTFADWLAGDGPRPVTSDDMDVHLSTLFHDVRPRGPMELRTLDALPSEWRSVPAVLLVGALYDEATRSRLHDLLAPSRAHLREMSVRAAQTGLKDPALCALAVEVWSYALEGAARLGVSRDRLLTVEAYLERFTLRGLTPADHLAALHPAAAFELCREPAPASDHADAS